MHYKISFFSGKPLISLDVFELLMLYSLEIWQSDYAFYNEYALPS